jgi:hypothetical protein
MTDTSQKTIKSDRETFNVPEGYEMAGTEFQISDIDVEDHPDGSGAGILTYELYHEDDVDGKELAKIVNNVILDAVKRTVEDDNN